MFSTFLSVFLSQRQVAVTAVTACLSLLCSGQIMTRMTAALTVIPVSFLRALLLPWCCSVPPPFTPPQWEMFICHIINVTLAVKKNLLHFFPVLSLGELLVSLCWVGRLKAGIQVRRCRVPAGSRMPSSSSLVIS